MCRRFSSIDGFPLIFTMLVSQSTEVVGMVTEERRTLTPLLTASDLHLTQLHLAIGIKTQDNLLLEGCACSVERCCQTVQPVEGLHMPCLDI